MNDYLKTLKVIENSVEFARTRLITQTCDTLISLYFREDKRIIFSFIGGKLSHMQILDKYLDKYNVMAHIDWSGVFSGATLKENALTLYQTGDRSIKIDFKAGIVFVS